MVLAPTVRKKNKEPLHRILVATLLNLILTLYALKLEFSGILKDCSSVVHYKLSDFTTYDRMTGLLSYFALLFYYNTSKENSLSSIFFIVYLTLNLVGNPSQIVLISFIDTFQVVTVNSQIFLFGFITHLLLSDFVKKSTKDQESPNYEPRLKKIYRFMYFILMLGTGYYISKWFPAYNYFVDSRRDDIIRSLKRFFKLETLPESIRFYYQKILQKLQLVDALEANTFVFESSNISQFYLIAFRSYAITLTHFFVFDGIRTFMKSLSDRIRDITKEVTIHSYWRIIFDALIFALVTFIVCYLNPHIGLFVQSNTVILGLILVVAILGGVASNLIDRLGSKWGSYVAARINRYGLKSWLMKSRKDITEEEHIELNKDGQKIQNLINLTVISRSHMPLIKTLIYRTVTFSIALGFILI
jgi:hypothetical protein